MNGSKNADSHVNGQRGQPVEKLGNDDESEDEIDEDGGNVQAGVPGGIRVSGLSVNLWLRSHSRKKKKKEKAKEKEGW